MKEIYLYLLTIPVFFGIDILWITVVAKKLYFKSIPNIRTMPNWSAAIVFYLLFIVGILIFAVLPNIDQPWQKSLIAGMLFGFFCYATYDLTNFSTLKNWPLNITIIDMVWGTTLTGVVAVISHFIANKIF